jgi:hypothetical protein
MIQDLDRTLQKIVIERGKLNKNEIDVAFDQPTSEWSSRLSRPTINCWCYDLRENAKLRNMDMTVSRNEQNRRASLRLPPLRFNLTYLVTAWARKVEDEHQLLWRALGAFAQTPMLTADLCEGALKEQPYDMPLTIGQVSETAANFADLWGVLDNEMRLGFNLQATLALDPERGFEEPLVLERRVGIGQTAVPRSEMLTARDQDLIFGPRNGGEDEDDVLIAFFRDVVDRLGDSRSRRRQSRDQDDHPE